MDNAKDIELVNQTLSGNTESYGVLMRAYEPPLLRYIVFLVHDPDLAEDIMQDSFIKAYRNLAGFKKTYKFSSWLYRIAHNTAMDAVKKRNPVVLEEPQLDRLTAVESNIAEKIDNEILAKDLNRCMNKLPTKYRAPVLLFYFQQKSYKDISDILRIPTATVGVRIGRAKSRLHKLCKELEVTP